MKFTLVSTVYNEFKRLDDTLYDLSLQTLQPTEIVITDAGSTDGTYEKLLDWKKRSGVPITILQKAKCNVAEGRNMAIRAAKYNLIASTDFGCRFHPGWLQSLMLPFQNKDVKVVGGTAAVIEEDIRTLPSKAAYLLYNGYRQIITDSYIPSSRSIAFYKELFDDVGGYCEWLTLAADDTVFGMLVKLRGYKFHIVETPFVYWGRHTKAKGYAKEFYRYGLGEGEARINTRNAMSIFTTAILRFAFCTLLLPLSLLVRNSKLSPFYLLVLLILAVGFKTYISYTITWLHLRSRKYNFQVYAYGFYLLELTRTNYLKGYFKGYFNSPSFRYYEAIKLHKLFPSLK